MAKRKISNGAWIFLSVLLIVGVLFAFGVPQILVSGEDKTSPEQCADSTGVLTVSVVNALEKGTTVDSPTLTAILPNGVQKTISSGTTTLAVGQEFDLLISKTDYIDTVMENLVMECGGLEVQGELYYATSDNPALRIKNDDGDYMTNAIAGGTTNQTDLNAGETLNLDVEFQGTALESSGDLIYIVEFPASSSANISEVTMVGASKVSLPTVHTSQNAASEIVAFSIPAVVGSEKKTYTLSISLEASKDLSGGVYTNWYSEQYFIDDDGTLVKGIEDSSGDAKYENTGGFNFYIN